MNGFIVIDKPEGLTSHDIVNSVRKILNLKKVGHTGTLDPFATGVLPVAVGEGTKAIPFLDESVKEYLAVMHLGVITDSQDCTGKVVAENSFGHINESVLKETFSRFVGTIKQVPPMFSALKRCGVPLYKLARQGKSVHREPRELTIFSLNIEKIELPKISFMVRCTRGTYVRTLASDLGDALGCGAHLSDLRRTVSGMFNVDDAISLEELSRLKEECLLAENIISPYRALSHLMDIALSDKGADRIRVGTLPDMEGFEMYPQGHLPAGEKLTLSYKERLLAVAENICSPWVNGQKNLRLLRVFN
ncbi:MAG TPA: tRNA pseudouridine(55) synthase TruB [Geobacteraceae bacterium]|jgi:tRNA pseudouridine55 synthase|nr:tRNA pseudouridine(55) synthase TruB [Geobacteraceae bacterium]